MNGKVVGQRYQIVRLIGAGGMGSVYEAVDAITGARVAVKLITAETARNATLMGRFEREARAAATIDTPHIVKVLDAGMVAGDDVPFLVMEYLEGEDVQQLIKRLGPLPPDLALRIVAQACLGLDRAHDARIIHRDIKPANFFLAKASGTQRVVKLLDFGIAKITHDPEVSTAETAGLTSTGSMLGSPLYMSPEQARGHKNLDRRADIWSLGVVLYQALTGRTPHQDTDALGELIIAICTEEPLSIQEQAPWVPPAAAAVAHHAMRFAPDERYQSAAEMLDDLRPLLPSGWGIEEWMFQPLAEADRGRVQPRLEVQPDQPVGRGSRSRNGAVSHSGSGVTGGGTQILPANTTQVPPVNEPTPGSSLQGFGATQAPAPVPPGGGARSVLIGLTAAMMLGVGGGAAYFVTRPRADVAPVLAASALPAAVGAPAIQAPHGEGGDPPRGRHGRGRRRCGPHQRRRRRGHRPARQRPQGPPQVRRRRGPARRGRHRGRRHPPQGGAGGAGLRRDDRDQAAARRGSGQAAGAAGFRRGPSAPAHDALRRMPFPRGLAVALILAATSLAAGARAEGVADEAELHFQLGSEAYSHGDFRVALEHFFLSNRLAPNRNVVFNIARTFEQMQRYADAHRHYVDARQGETDPQAIRDVNLAIARIAPNVAVLDVVTTPPGATLYLDRRELGSRGRAPRPLALPPGTYRVVAELDGYEPATSAPVAAKLGGTTRVELQLARIVGTVRVEVTGAASAVVRADDERGPALCTAPCAAVLPPGVHQLYFSGEGLSGAPRQVTVVARQATRVTAEMSPRTGSLVVSSDEVGAAASIAGKTLGFTPVVIPGVPAGTQRVRVTLHGYTPIERTVEIKPGEQTQLADIELTPIHEVTAVSRYAEQLDDAPSSVSVIDGQELRAFGYPTIAEALRGTRGFYLSNDRVYYSAGVRGIGQPNDYGNRVLVLSDGQSLNDNLVNSSYIGSDGRVDLHDVDRIEVVRGPGSLLYGTGAFSGVVNLVTRPRDEPDQVHLDVGTYDNSVFHTSAGFHLNLGKDRGIWASASFARSDGVDVDIPLKAPPAGAAATQTVGGADKFTSGGVAGRAYWGPFTVQWFYQKRDQSTPIGSYGTVLGDPRSSSTDTRLMVEARFERKLGDSFELMTRLHANRYFFDGVYIFPTSTHLEDFAGSWGGAEARLAWSPDPRIRVTAGGEAQYDPQVALMGVAYATTARPDQYLGVSDPYSFGAAYVIAEGSPVRWLHASAGVRVDDYSTFGAIVVPRGSVIFHPSADGTLKIMGGRAFRGPSVYERDYNDDNQTEAKAKPLLPESVYSGEIEYSHHLFQRWVGLVAVNASYLEHLISTAPDPRFPAAANIVSYQNSAVPALSMGAEAELRRDWRQGFMFSANYGYQYARYLDPVNHDPRLVAAPEHTASIRGVAPIVSDLVSIGARATLEAPRRIDTETSDTTPTAVVLDATLSGSASKLGLRYTLGLYNLTGWHYALPVTENFLSRTMPQNGRTFLLDLLGTLP